jgi:hypothetical protein
VAALLHDIAEILMVFAPGRCWKLRHSHKDKRYAAAMPSSRYWDSCCPICKGNAAMGLAAITVDPDDDSVRSCRACAPELAVNPRHTANGWDDAALPDDYKEIAELLRMPAEQVMPMLEEDEGIVRSQKPH